jgi:hypothetical protein
MTRNSDNSKGILMSVVREALTLRTQPLDTTVVSLHDHEYSVIEYEDLIVIKRIDQNVDLGYLIPCIRTSDIDVYVCDVDGEIAGLGVIEQTDELLPIHLIHKNNIFFMLKLQTELSTTPFNH